METKELSKNNVPQSTDKSSGVKLNEDDVMETYVVDGIIGRIHDEPIDLTFTNNNNNNNHHQNNNSNKPFKAIVMECGLDDTINDHIFNENKHIANIIEMRNLMINNDDDVSLKKKRGRKRKSVEDNNVVNYVNVEDEAINNASLACCSRSVVTTLPDSALQNINSKEAEVLKAAKSLFSKRTQTLYHWLYPNTPKSQLKTAVALSWETLGYQEKEFYISQVLGRFGFSQSSLMVNPQLGGIPQFDISHNFMSPHNLNKPSRNVSNESIGSKERSGIDDSNNNKKVKRKTGKVGRPCKNKLQINAQKQDGNGGNIPRQIENDSQEELFRDDPELNREFAQFKWSLHSN